MANIKDLYVERFGFEEQGTAVATPSSGNWRLYFKSDGLYVIDDAGAETGPLAAATSSTPPNCYQTTLASDLTLTTTGTEYTVLTKSLGAGTYLVDVTVLFQCNHASTGYVLLKVTDGASTVFMETEEDVPNNVTQTRNVHFNRRVTLSGTTTLTLIARSGDNGDKIKADSPTWGSSGHIATVLTALAVTSA